MKKDKEYKQAYWLVDGIIVGVFESTAKAQEVLDEYGSVVPVKEGIGEEYFVRKEDITISEVLP